MRLIYSVKKKLNMDNHILETSQYKVFKKLCKNKIMAYIITGTSEDP